MFSLSDPFVYQLWLSTDARLDPKSDHRLGFKINTAPLAKVFRASENVPVHGTVVIPSDLDPVYCGPVFLIAEVDSTNVVSEVDETNNVRVQKLTVNCAQGETSYYHLDTLYKVTHIYVT